MASGNGTVLSVGSVTISANGGQTGDLLSAIIKASAAYTVVTVGAGATSLPAPSGGTGPFELVIQPGYTGTMSIPSGYALVVNGATGDTNPVSGGDSTTAIVGNSTIPLNYTGGAGTVVGAGGTGSVDDTANNALMSFVGSYSVTAGGNNDTVNVDDSSGSSVKVTVSGSGSTINIGGGSSPSGSGAAAGVVSTNTVDVTGTSDVLFDTLGSNVVLLGQLTEYVSAAGLGTSTLTSATGGADTIFALSATDYNAALAASSLFLGSNTGAVTVQAGTSATLFGGSAGGTYTEGTDSTGSFGFFARFGVPNASTVPAVDNITGGASAPQVSVWGNSNEDITVTQAGSAAAGAGGTYVAFGGTDTINAMNARGGNAFVAWNASLPASSSLPNGLNFTGNTTLIGSNAGSDDFAVFSASPEGLQAASPHTIDIQNWQQSDVLFLGGYSAADVTTADTALAAAGGGAASFTLSDGTTIKFDTASPTKVFHS